jgi:hypothetical protein
MDMANCVLELRSRIQALEAGATCPHIVSSDEGTSYCRLAEQNAPTVKESLTPAPAGSLVERVAERIEFGIDANQDPEGIARVAIRAMAAWLKNERESPFLVDLLVQEAEQ